MKTVSIHVGEIYASKSPAIIHTLVGSCVAVCLFDPIHQIGGMNHILLPGRADMKQFDAPARYGIHAMELLINKMMKLGADRKQIIAKVFGGAHLLPSISYENGVGRKNVEFVTEFLRNESVRVLTQDTNGHESRRIYFHTDSGDVFLKRISSRYYTDLVSKEKKIFKKAQRECEIPATVNIFLKNGNDSFLSA